MIYKYKIEGVKDTEKTKALISFLARIVSGCFMSVGFKEEQEVVYRFGKGKVVNVIYLSGKDDVLAKIVQIFSIDIKTYVKNKQYTGYFIEEKSKGMSLQEIKFYLNSIAVFFSAHTYPLSFYPKRESGHFCLNKSTVFSVVVSLKSVKEILEELSVKTSRVEEKKKEIKVLGEGIVENNKEKILVAI